MGLFGNLFGGSKTVTQQTSNAPWSETQPYLKEAFSEAQRLYREPGPEYFPDSTVVGFSPQTDQALQMSEQMALQGSPIQQAGQQSYLDTLQGNYLDNPFFQGALESQTRTLRDQFTQEAIPGLQSSFTMSGGRGSSAEDLAAGRLTDSFARAFADTAGELGYRNYSDERGRQAAFTQGAPQYAMARFQDPQQLANVGAARESLAQAFKADEVNRYNFGQNVQANKLAQYLGLVSGGYGSEGTSSQPFYRNYASDFIGGGLLGAAVGKEFGKDFGISPLAGAGIGGLLGLF